MFKVGDQAIHLFYGRTEARLVTITGETQTRLKTEKQVFRKTSSHPEAIGRNSHGGYLKPVTPELMEFVELTLKEDQIRLDNQEFQKACKESDEAEYKAWLETDEGQAAEALQTDYIGATIERFERSHANGRFIEFYLIGFGGKQVEKVTIKQEINWMDSGNELQRPEVSFSSFGRGTCYQAMMFQELLRQACVWANSWEEDNGKAWDREKHCLIGAE